MEWIDDRYMHYTNVAKQGGGEKWTKYENWKDGEKTPPNLNTYLTALNLSQPIIQSQFELRMSRWPRTIFFAKNVTIPEITTNTQTLNHMGFEISIACNPKYSSYEISFTIIADKEGYHYQDFRNMVLQSSHPLVSGDPRSTIDNIENPSGEDTLDIRLRNTPLDETHHHWIVHNFRPTTLGSIEMSHDSSSFVEFDVTGTFTHIDYDCGHYDSPTPPPMVEPIDKPEPPDVDEMNKFLDSAESRLNRIKKLKPNPSKTGGKTSSAPGPSNATYTNRTPINMTLPNGVEINLMAQSAVGVRDGDPDHPLDEDEMKLAEETNSKLTDAAEQLRKDLEKIGGMSESFKHKMNDSWGNETEDTSEFNIQRTPKPGQDPDDPDYEGDMVGAGVSGKVKFNTPEQKKAYDEAIAKYKAATQGVIDEYKDKKSKLDNNKPLEQKRDELQARQDELKGEIDGLRNLLKQYPKDDPKYQEMKDDYDQMVAEYKSNQKDLNNLNKKIDAKNGGNQESDDEGKQDFENKF